VKIDQVISTLHSLSNPAAAERAAYYGIHSKNLLGLSAPALHKLAREIGKDHEFALQLWESGIADTRILAALIDIPSRLSEGQMEAWASDFDSWGICDGVCLHFFRQYPLAHTKAVEWSTRPEEYVKRAGFVLMAALAIHDKKAEDSRFEVYLPIILREAVDERFYVKKGVNWALRQIGKRNVYLNVRSIDTGEKMLLIKSPSASWIAHDALRELKGEKVQKRLKVIQ
jgi:3-methyladenine DNA glycosylase AlkD